MEKPIGYIECTGNNCKAITLKQDVKMAHRDDTINPYFISGGILSFFIMICIIFNSLRRHHENSNNNTH